MLGMYSMYPNMYSNTIGLSNRNVPNDFKLKYGNGYSDFGTRPYAQPYPMATIPQSNSTKSTESFWQRFSRKVFGKI